MTNYKKMYLTLFNQITDSIKALKKELEHLKQSQQKVEELYIKSQTNQKSKPSNPNPTSHHQNN